MSRKAVAAMVALNALRGWFAPVPSDMGIEEVLREMPEMGGVKLNASPDEIAEKASRIENSKITYVSANMTVDGDLLVNMIVSLPDAPLTSTDELLANDGYCLCYVWNAGATHFSEYGDIVVAKMDDGHIRRVS